VLSFLVSSFKTSFSGSNVETSMAMTIPFLGHHSVILNGTLPVTNYYPG